MTEDKDPNSDPVHEPQPTIKPRKRHKRILIVECESESATLANSLGNQGFTATVTRLADAAFQAATTELPDLVIIDNGSYNGDGLALARRLFDDEDAYRIPVIMLGANRQTDTVRKSRAAGCCYYIQQPYDPNVLLLAVEASLKI